MEEQARRAGLKGCEEFSSAARLEAVWAEEDAEIEARLGGTEVMSYRFKCQYCGSQFSLEQQKDDHEAECGKAGAGPEKAKAKDAVGSHPCKYCGQVFTNFGEYGAHRWAAHREEVLAELAEKRKQRKADEAKIDSAVAGQPVAGRPTARPSRKRPSIGAAPAPSAEKASRSQPAYTRVAGVVCPTCGGVIPPTTAQLVDELKAAGIAESQAFEAARIARRVLADSATP